MKKIAIATLLIFSVSLPVTAKRSSSGSKRGTAHRMNRTHTNRTNQGNAQSCQICETNFTTCLQNATNTQMKGMCSQMKQNCRSGNKC